eukprot:Seg2527.3 transcript_id=Seg2527.3/GoldUCD/mRNA.D3Y31 product="putative glycosyltransferase STELLO1" protein_id=Seg2527.3/GoldUCD/D3Y31
MGKKAMYTKLVENKDEDGNVYYGETVLGDGGFGKTASSSTSKCKLTCCKVLIFTLLFSVVLSVYLVSNMKSQGGPKPKEDDMKNEDKSVMRANGGHFGMDCKYPVRRELSDILLAINFNHPHYSNIPILLKLFKHVFPHIVFCGPERDPTKKYKIIEVAHPTAQRGFYGYQCLALAIKRRPGFTGYLYINDDMIINWWVFLDLDKSKIWTGKLVKPEESTPVGAAPKSKWWKRADTARRCTEAFLEIEQDKSEKLLKQYYRNTNNERVCVNSWSDIFYIPAHHSETFMELSTIFYDHLVFVEAAVQMILFYLDNQFNMVLLPGLYLPDKFGYGVDYGLPGLAWSVYTRELAFIHPYKLDPDSTTKNKDDFQAILVDVSNEVVRTSCLDIVKKHKMKQISTFQWSKAVKVDWSKYKRR